MISLSTYIGGFSSRSAELQSCGEPGVSVVMSNRVVLTESEPNATRRGSPGNSGAAIPIRSSCPESAADW